MEGHKNRAQSFRRIRETRSCGRYKFRRHTASLLEPNMSDNLLYKWSFKFCQFI